MLPSLSEPASWLNPRLSVLGKYSFSYRLLATPMRILFNISPVINHTHENFTYPSRTVLVPTLLLPASNPVKLCVRPSITFLTAAHPEVAGWSFL